MGARKKISADKRKEALKTKYFAKLNNVPTSPRKMRLVADMVRGMEAFKALGVLKFSSKEASARLEKLLRSAIAKRLRPAPRGRGYRIRKRSNHVTLFVDTISSNKPENQD